MPKRQVTASKVASGNGSDSALASRKFMLVTLRWRAWSRMKSAWRDLDRWRFFRGGYGGGFGEGWVAYATG